MDCVWSGPPLLKRRLRFVNFAFAAAHVRQRSRAYLGRPCCLLRPAASEARPHCIGLPPCSNHRSTAVPASSCCSLARRQRSPALPPAPAPLPAPARCLALQLAPAPQPARPAACPALLPAPARCLAPLPGPAACPARSLHRPRCIARPRCLLGPAARSAAGTGSPRLRCPASLLAKPGPAAREAQK